MKKLSIIVPLYKVEDYLGKCLDSLLSQGMPASDYEIIAINDGSPDASAAIARQYASAHPQIVFIDQENKGVSAARNAGLDRACGTFVLFVDPDDWIEENSLPPILDAAISQDLDVLYLSLDQYDESGAFICHVDDCGKPGVISDGFTHPRRTFLPTLYRRETIGGIRFRQGIIRGQDTVFNVMVQSQARRCSCFPGPYYGYLLRESSSRTVQGSEKNFASCLLAIDTIHDFRKAHFPDPAALQKDYFDRAMLVFIQRMMEWIVLPNRSKIHFDKLKAHLDAAGIGYLIEKQAEAMPGFDQPFSVFMLRQRIAGYWDALKGKFIPSRR
jgi:glycosyltransferase involved in cell wall biosynthesis